MPILYLFIVFLYWGLIGAAPGSGVPLGIPGFGVRIGAAPGSGVPIGDPKVGVPIGVASGQCL